MSCSSCQDYRHTYEQTYLFGNADKTSVGWSMNVHDGSSIVAGLSNHLWAEVGVPLGLYPSFCWPWTPISGAIYLCRTFLLLSVLVSMIRLNQLIWNVLPEIFSQVKVRMQTLNKRLNMKDFALYDVIYDLYFCYMTCIFLYKFGDLGHDHRQCKTFADRYWPRRVMCLEGAAFSV